MNKKRVAHLPTEEKAKPAPLTLADVTVNHPRFSMATGHEEMHSFSGAQLALLLTANEYEGNLSEVADTGEIAEEVRGLCACLGALSACKVHLTETDDESERQAIDFLERSLQRLADRVNASREGAVNPERYRVVIAAKAA
jgi:hypothetical protein